MNEHEQKMCEMQGEFFELSKSSFLCSSPFFVAKFMYSELAKKLDNIEDPYNFIGPSNMIFVMKGLFPSLNIEGYNKYPSRVLHWMGYIYRAYCLIKKKTSSWIYKELKAEELFVLYDSFHTFSPEYCVERLEELINERKPAPLTDYEIFKQIRERASNNS